MNTQIAVVQYGPSWRVIDQDGACGEPLAYDDALACGERLARQARRQGLGVDLLVQRGSELRPHQTFDGRPNFQA